MSYNFDQDPIGSILEYGLLVHQREGTGRQSWRQANINNLPPPSIAVTVDLTWNDHSFEKSHLLNLLERGRNREAVRRQLDRIFHKLEMEHLIEPFSRDDNLSTTHRVLTPLGRELIDQGAHLEYLSGLPYIANHWKQSIVKIYHPTDVGIGTGFLVRPNLVATALHVVERQGFVVELESGQILNYSEVRRPNQSFDLDLALIELNDNLQNPPPFRLCPDYQLLDEVVILGYPRIPQSTDAFLVANRGEVSSEVILFEGDLQAIIVSCLLRGGHSGSPVINIRGQVIGLVSRNLFQQPMPDESINEGLGYAAAISSEWIDDLIQQNV